MTGKLFAVFLCLYLLEAVAAIIVPPTIQKCCPINKELNVSPMFCALAPNQNSNANFHFDATTRFGRPHCPEDMIIVMYNSRTTSLTLVDDGLIVPWYNNKPSVRISPEKFCIDNVVDDDDSNSPRVWAAWVCQPSSVCEHLPCIQRCCGPSEHLRHVNGFPQCVAHIKSKPFVPEFHFEKNKHSSVEGRCCEHHNPNTFHSRK
jgi:hypothetical protein